MYWYDLDHTVHPLEQRACGATDNASDYGSEDSRFESWQARTHFLCRSITWSSFLGRHRTGATDRKRYHRTAAKARVVYRGKGKAMHASCHDKMRTNCFDWYVINIMWMSGLCSFAATYSAHLSIQHVVAQGKHTNRPQINQYQGHYIHYM